MLLRVLFLCAALVAIGETLLQAAAALAVSALHRQGIAATQTAFASAAQLAQVSVANAMAAGATLPPSLPPQQTCVASDGAACTMLVQTTVTISTPQPSPCAIGGCDLYVQQNDAVGEGRAIASIAVAVSGPSGTTIARRSASVLFRTLHCAPYALPTGALDATLDDFESGSGNAAGPIEVIYQNAVSGAVLPANVWSGISSAPLPVSAWSP